MGSGRPKHVWSWTLQGTQRVVRRASVSMSARKWRSKKACLALNERNWQTGNNGEGGWGIQPHFLPQSSLATSLPHLIHGWTTRQGPGEQSPSHCKQRSGLWPPKELEHAYVYRTWWDASQTPERIGWCSCQAAHHDIWKVMALRWTPQSMTGKGGILHPFLKMEKKKTWGTWQPHLYAWEDPHRS